MNMKLNGLLGLLTIWPAIIAANQAVTLPQADISYKGTTKDGIEHFQNIKYAHDTCGHRRFAPPEPYTPPSGTIVDATRPGPECPQLAHAIPPFLDETTNMSEDCLHLRIARPVGIRPDEKLPVVLYVHGGGLVKGSCSDSHTEPDRLVQYAMSIGKPIIFVAMNYRLSIFGFARLPILKDKKSINVGVRDQRLAFEWVKNNIEAFGGDNTRITAYGLSAGATLTSLHLTSFAGEKGVPFTQAWLMSGPPGTALNMTSDATTLHTLAVADKVNCVKENERKTLDCLMNLPMGELLDAAVDYSTANHPPAGLFTFIPSIDDDVFTERPSVLYRRGDFVKGIPLVLGWTQDDGALNAGPADLYTAEKDIITAIQNFATNLTNEDYDAIFSAYPEKDFAEDLHNYNSRKDSSEPTASVHWFRASRILRDLLFTCPSIDFGLQMSQFSKEQNNKFPGVRLYDLNQSMLTPLWKGAGMPYIQIVHGSDTPYIFGGLFPEGEISEDDMRLANRITGALINFAYTGNPASDKEDNQWPEICGSASNGCAASDTKVHVLGGPHGDGAANIFDPYWNLEDMQEEFGFKIQMGDMAHMEAMKSPAYGKRNREIQREKLVARCEVINGLAERLGV